MKGLPSGDPRSLKILYGYSYFASAAYADVEQLTLDHLARLRAAGYQVEGFCLTLDAPGPCLNWPDLDRRWRWGDRSLLGMYGRLEQALAGKDAFINASGINLHPDFVCNLPVFTMFQCYDDPENSHNLSRPAAAAYDLCLVGNVAEVATYRSWGVRAAEWSPMGLDPSIYDASLTETDILEGTRDIDLLLMADRTSPWRTQRLDQLSAAFPSGHFYGKGWPKGYLPAAEQMAHLRRTKIGPNLHNSTGPINFRTFYLPANGVLQICDNRSHLGQVFTLGEEVIGFETIGECIDLCRYYLDHDRERREIAVRGYRRAVTEYSETAVFERKLVSAQRLAANEREPEVMHPAAHHAAQTAWRHTAFPLVQSSAAVATFARRGARWLGRRLGGRPSA